MDNLLPRLAELVRKHLTINKEGAYTLSFIPDGSEKELIIFLESLNCIQEINVDKLVISGNDINLIDTLEVEIVSYELHKFNFYDSLDSFINENEFAAPDDFYIKDIDYHHSLGRPNQSIVNYFAIIKVISCLSSLSVFESNDEGKTYYILQDKSVVAVPVIYDRALIEKNTTNTDNINVFVGDVENSVDRKKIYTKELIDFLSGEVAPTRLGFLFKNFDTFYHQCETAYGFFLSDFSYGKLKLELESAILDFSKNIRSIITDSQSRLVAIPAAFLIAATQLDLSNNFSLKNLLIILSSLVFSFLMEIFIKNQESSLNIFADNIVNYKTTFKIKNQGIAEKANKTLQETITNSFISIDNELKNQQKRLNWTRIINWGTSSSLILLTVFTANGVKSKLTNPIVWLINHVMAR